MFSKTTTATVEAQAERRPGFEVPEHLAAGYPAAYRQARQRGGGPVEPFFERFVRKTMTSVAARELGLTFVPGSVRRPPAVVAEGDFTQEELAQWQRDYAASEDAKRTLGAQFDARVDELVASIVDDPISSLEFYFHAQAIELAEETARREEDRRKKHAQFVKANTCPSCGHCNPAENGEVEHRDLKNTGRVARNRIMFHSCARCFEVAQAQYAAHVAGQLTADGTRTRSEAVWEALALH